MRAIIFVCALAALLGSYGADANLGAPVGAGRTKDTGLDINDVAALNAAQSSMDASGALRSHRGRRLSVSPIPTSDDGQSLQRIASDVAVHTRIQTCQGVAVTITSFGGDDWDAGLDTLCEDSDRAAESATTEPTFP
ncbi:MAG: hypothetical protein HKN81_06320 [Gammaproteobacteria bacterium]|nr:hypothetical protein [Gammaproteobacteria bacterium]NND36736.1 hypothetical protein [Gammaproteobacteria bacterium]